jgi:lipopolysaccharide transport system permease protein
VLLYCGFLLAIRHGIPPTILWLPVLMVPQVLFTLGVSWFLAGLGAFVRDLGQMIGFILTIWFFMTPICYPESQLLARAPFMTKNPMYVLVHAYRAVLLHDQAPSFGALWKFSALAILVFVLGHAWFYKLRKSFADMI